MAKTKEKAPTPVKTLMQKKLGEEFENPKIPARIRAKCEEFRGCRLQRLELQKQEEGLEADILKFMQDDEEIGKAGFVLELDNEVVHFRIDDEPKVKTRKLENREE